MDIIKNIKHLMIDTGIKRQDMATELGLTVGSLANKMAGNRKFSIEEVKQLSVLFNCSADELLK